MDVASQTMEVKFDDDLRVLDIDLEGLVKSLECPVCLRVFTPPVKLCRSGHCICIHCFDRSERCGLCREDFSDMRVFAIESAIDTIRIPCCYNADGCTEMLKSTERNDHEDNCAYRPVLCRILSSTLKCEEKAIDLRNYKSHVLESHKIVHVHSGEQNKLEINYSDENILSNRGCWPLQAFSFDGQAFLIRNNLREGIFSSWCSIMGAEDDAKKYRVTMSVQAGLGIDERAVIWIDQPVYSAHVQNIQEVIFEEEEPFCVNLDSIPKLQIESVAAIKRLRPKPYKNPSKVPGDFTFCWTVLYEFVKVDDIEMNAI